MGDVKAPILPEMARALKEENNTPQAHRAVEIDFDRYQAILDDPQLTQDQQEQVIMALWSILSTFVELGFNIHPVQQVCGQVELDLDLERNPDSHEIKSHDEQSDKGIRAQD